MARSATGQVGHAATMSVEKHWKPLSQLEIKLAEAAILKLMRARFPGRPVTVRHHGNPVLESSAARRHNDGEAEAPR